jgi:putative membrane protein insertion efficiency factor
MKRILLAAIGFYKRWLSPALHSLGVGGCKFRPTCSEYAAEAIAMHGALRGIMLAASRLVRCHPFGPGGFDPVPLTNQRQFARLNAGAKAQISQMLPSARLKPCPDTNPIQTAPAPNRAVAHEPLP